MSIFEATLFISVSELVREIELGLKARLEQFLRTTHDQGWWAVLPQQVQRNAENRHRWATAQIGSRRAGSRENIAWLSMGDVIRMLDTLSGDEWKTCLQAENRRKKTFERALRRVKAFRDYHLAHPKPRRPSDYELTMLCKAIQRLPTILRPHEWNEVIDLLGKIKRMSREDRKLFSSAAHSSSWKYPDSLLSEWVCCFDLHRPGACSCVQKLSPGEAKWREHVIILCANLDAGGYVFFGRED